jgi:cytochrome c553
MDGMWGWNQVGANRRGCSNAYHNGGGTMKRIGLAISLILLLAGMAVAAEQPSVALGEKLFNDPGLGGSTNDKSCGSCHPGGEGLKGGEAPGLAAIINQCLAGALGGQPLEEDSSAMQSLILYLESLPSP